MPTRAQAKAAAAADSASAAVHDPDTAPLSTDDLDESRYTPVRSIPGIVDSLRKSFRAGTSRPLAARKAAIEGILAMITHHEKELAAALRADLGATPFWIRNVELGGIHEECDMALHHMDEWAAPRHKSSPVLMLPGKSYVQPEPYGVVSITSPWNYPISLALNPLIAALAAGNCVVLKPSEVSANCSRLLADLLPHYVSEDLVRTVQGGIPQAGALLKEKVDLIIYTGSGMVAKHYMKAAAENLTPVLLELGGKCPAIVAPDADIDATAKRLLWGKFTLNCGQTCLSPDYILTTPKTEAKLIEALKREIVAQFSDDPKSSPEVSRIINKRHAKRVLDLLDDDAIEVIHGGQGDVDAHFVAPTLVKAPADKPSKVMEGEIFGPILPIVTVPSVQAAVDFVNDHQVGKPLALYAFTSDAKTEALIMGNTSAGGTCINDASIHAGNPELPFGGVGESGTGAYHGEHGFDACSHLRAVYKKYGTDPSLRFAPYTDSELGIFYWLRANSPRPSTIRTFGIMALLSGLLMGVSRYATGFSDRVMDAVGVHDTATRDVVDGWLPIIAGGLLGLTVLVQFTHPRIVSSARASRHPKRIGDGATVREGGEGGAAAAAGKSKRA